MAANRYIPEKVKREVRERCGYTCVICGHLIWEYEHIVPFSVCKEHKSENITLLCQKHHAEVTAGRLSKDYVREANNKPFGKTEKFFSSYKFHLCQVDRVNCGGLSIFSEDKSFGTVPLARVFGEDLVSIGLENGIPLLSIRTPGGEDGSKFRIVNNEILFDSGGLVDINFVGSTLSVAARDFGFYLSLEVKDSVARITELRCVYDGIFLFIDAFRVVIFDEMLTPNTFQNAIVAFGSSPSGDFALINIVDIRESDKLNKTRSMVSFRHARSSDIGLNKKLISMSKGFRSPKDDPTSLHQVDFDQMRKQLQAKQDALRAQKSVIVVNWLDQTDAAITKVVYDCWIR